MGVVGTLEWVASALVGCLTMFKCFVEVDGADVVVQVPGIGRLLAVEAAPGLLVGHILAALAAVEMHVVFPSFPIVVVKRDHNTATALDLVERLHIVATTFLVPGKSGARLFFR